MAVRHQPVTKGTVIVEIPAPAPERPKRSRAKVSPPPEIYGDILVQLGDRLDHIDARQAALERDRKQDVEVVQAQVLDWLTDSDELLRFLSDQITAKVESLRKELGSIRNSVDVLRGEVYESNRPRDLPVEIPVVTKRGIIARLFRRGA